MYTLTDANDNGVTRIGRFCGGLDSQNGPGISEYRSPETGIISVRFLAVSDNMFRGFRATYNALGNIKINAWTRRCLYLYQTAAVDFTVFYIMIIGIYLIAVSTCLSSPYMIYVSLLYLWYMLKLTRVGRIHVKMAVPVAAHSELLV